MLVTLSGIVIDVSPEQSRNAEAPMLVTLFGIVIDVRASHAQHIWFQIVVHPGSRTTETRLGQNSNGLKSMY